MNTTKKRWNYILWNEGFGFSSLIILAWLSELLHIPHYIFGEGFAPDWNRAALRSLVLFLIWGWVHLSTKRLLKHLHYLEEFQRICGWCRRVCHNDEWLTLEQYFNTKFDAKTTHGMCPSCRKGIEAMEDQKESRPASPAP